MLSHQWPIALNGLFRGLHVILILILELERSNNRRNVVKDLGDQLLFVKLIAAKTAPFHKFFGTWASISIACTLSTIVRLSRSNTILLWCVRCIWLDLNSHWKCTNLTGCWSNTRGLWSTVSFEIEGPKAELALTSYSRNRLRSAKQFTRSCYKRVSSAQIFGFTGATFL